MSLPLVCLTHSISLPEVCFTHGKCLYLYSTSLFFSPFSITRYKNQNHALIGG